MQEFAFCEGWIFRDYKIQFYIINIHVKPLF